MGGDFDGDAVRALLSSFQSGAETYEQFTTDKKTAKALYDLDS
jgi:hypothetical protein